MRKLALLLAFPLLLAAAPTVDAATGTVHFSGGTHTDLKNPPTGQCILTAPPYPGPRTVDNYTNTQVTVYLNDTCKTDENTAVLPPGGHYGISPTWWPAASVVAVKVG